jgi:electron transport complex protein RnfC
MDVPLIKTTNCLLASTLAELPPPPPALPCIRCGECAEVCPASLLPQQLHFFALGQEHEQLKAYNLFDCIECGACAYVCPSSIPLVQYYRAAKGEIRALEQKQQKADHSKQRFELRQERLRRAEEQKEADRKARAERAARAKATQAETSSVPNQDDPVARVQAQKAGLSEQQKKLKIEASMAQVALKKAEKQLAAHATLELETQVAELRIAAANAQKALDEANAAVTDTTVTTPAANDEAAKKAKIEAAMLRAQIRKLEKLDARDPEQDAELSRLQSQLAETEKALASIQDSAPIAPDKPAAQSDDVKKAKIEAAMLRAQIRKLEKLDARNPEQDAELSRLQSQLAEAEKMLASTTESAPPPASKTAGGEALKKAKIELAMRRAELKKAEKAGAEDAELSKLRDGLASAEQALHDVEANSGKPEPELVRTDKRPIDELTRTLKTDVAFARADLRKLERDTNSDTRDVEAARTRLNEAERKLQEHTDS